MLNKTGSRFSSLKYTVALPVLIAAVIAVSCVRRDAPLPPSTTSPRSGISSQPIEELSNVDVQPEFPGGMVAMYAYIRDNVHYPVEALNGKSEGTTTVQFTVDVDGKVKDVDLKGRTFDQGLHSDDPKTPSVVTELIQHLMHGASLIDNENVRVVASMPNWSPGEKDGHAVATRLIIPVKYAVGNIYTRSKN